MQEEFEMALLGTKNIPVTKYSNIGEGVVEFYAVPKPFLHSGEQNILNQHSWMLKTRQSLTKNFNFHS